VVTRIVGFGPLTIRYDESVLEPRPWTLSQSEWAAALLAQCPPGPVLELCSGAGQIGLATAAMSGRDVVLVDASAEACKFSQLNAEAAGLGGTTDVRHGSMEQVLAPEERFALVLADPPYLPSSSTGLFPDDPLHAVDGGDDGLSLARVCLQVAASHTELGAPVLLQLRDLAQADRLAGELHDGHPLTHVETRVFDPHGAVLLLRRTA
jgi:methylase of polypeptide subunit release factors